MKCLVLGGNGFIGQNLVRALLQAGYNVVSFDAFRTPLAIRPEDYPNLSLIKGDYLNRSDLKRACIGVDIVYHFIWTSNPSFAGMDLSYELESNVLPTVRLLDICIECKVKKFVFASSGGAVYGHSGGVPKKETDALRPVSTYGMGKKLTEQVLSFYAQESGLVTFIMRISNPFGAGQYGYKNQGIIPIVADKIKKGETVTIYGQDVLRDYVFIEDLVWAIIELTMKQPGSECFQIYNLGSGESVSNRDVVNMIQEVLGVVSDFTLVKRRAIDVDHVVLDVSNAEIVLGRKLKGLSKSLLNIIVQE